LIEYINLLSKYTANPKNLKTFRLFSFEDKKKQSNFTLFLNLFSLSFFLKRGLSKGEPLFFVYKNTKNNTQALNKPFRETFLLTGCHNSNKPLKPL
jgi:hypothetical protein